MATEYQAQRAARKRKEPAPARQTRTTYEPAVAAARTAERNRRNAEGRRRALFVLSQRHSEEFEMLLRAELAGVYSERGPLPGDEISAEE